MAELPPDPNDVYDTNGAKLGTVPLSAQQLDMLQAGNTISVFFHTPQLMHSALGISKGTFKLYRQGNKTTTADTAAFNQYLELQSGITRASARAGSQAESD